MQIQIEVNEVQLGVLEAVDQLRRELFTLQDRDPKAVGLDWAIDKVVPLRDCLVEDFLAEVLHRWRDDDGGDGE